MPNARNNRQQAESSDRIRNMDGDIHSKITKIDDRQRADHDTLTKIDVKMDNLLVAMNELKDGFNKRLIATETRIEYFNNLEAEIKPRDMKKSLDSLVDWKDKFGFTWKVVVFVSSTISAIVGFILAVVSQISNLFPKN